MEKDVDKVWYHQGREGDGIQNDLQDIAANQRQSLSLVQDAHPLGPYHLRSLSRCNLMLLERRREHKRTQFLKRA